MNNVDLNRIMNNVSKVKAPNSYKNQDKQAFTKDFKSVFEKELKDLDSIKFSKHAIERLQSRNINLTQKEVEKIDEAVKKAEKKGIKETLIIMGSNAFIANVKNKTVVTATCGENLNDNVFTNIDGAVII